MKMMIPYFSYQVPHSGASKEKGVPFIGKPVRGFVSNLGKKIWLISLAVNTAV